MGCGLAKAPPRFAERSLFRVECLPELFIQNRHKNPFFKDECSPELSAALQTRSFVPFANKPLS
eukprot:297187-Amphidinium_carterae.1